MSYLIARAKSQEQEPVILWAIRCIEATMGRSGFSSGGAGGGGRDTNCSMPVEQYRKRIGRQVCLIHPTFGSLKICWWWKFENEQDSKKEKKFVKDVVKKSQELKENTSKAFTESVRTKILGWVFVSILQFMMVFQFLVLMTVLSVVAGIYGILYYSIGHWSSQKLWYLSALLVSHFILYSMIDNKGYHDIWATLRLPCVFLSGWRCHISWAWHGSWVSALRKISSLISNVLTDTLDLVHSPYLIKSEITPGGMILPPWDPT